MRPNRESVFAFRTAPSLTLAHQPVFPSLPLSEPALAEVRAGELPFAENHHTRPLAPINHGTAFLQPQSALFRSLLQKGHDPLDPINFALTI